MESKNQFDFSGFKSPEPQGFKILLANENCLLVLHKASKRQYRVTKNRGKFWLYASSRLNDKWDFVWRCDDLYRMLSALGFI